MQAVLRTPLSGRVAGAVGLLMGTAVGTLMLLTVGQGVGHASTCSIATNSWIGGAGSWETAASWSAGHVPTSSEYVCISATGGATVTLSGTDVAASLEAQTPISISGTLTLSDTGQPSTLSTVTLTGQLAGAATVTVNDSMAWSRGAMSGSGTTQIASTATLTMIQSDYAYLQAGRTLTNAGTMHWSSPSGYSFWGYGGAVFTNTGSMYVDSNGTLLYNAGGSPAPLFVNSGTVQKTAGSSAATLAWPVQNQGTLAAAAGTIDLSGGDAGLGGSGSFTNVAFDGGSFALGSASTLGGAITVGGGTVTDNGTSQSVDSVALPGSGVFAVNGALSTGTLSISASSAQLGGTGTVTVTSGGSWTVGTMGGTGTTRIVSGASFTVNPANTGYLTLVGTGRHLVNDGTVTVQGSPSWYFAQGSTFSNTGTLLLTGTGTLSNYASGTGGVPVLTNTGLVRRTAGSGGASVAVANNGTISADPGLTVSLSGGDAGLGGSGSFANVAFDGGSFTLGSASTLGGAITVGGGTVTDNGTSQSVDSRQSPETVKT